MGLLLKIARGAIDAEAEKSPTPTRAPVVAATMHKAAPAIEQYGGQSARPDFTLADLAEIDRLLGELATLERWAPDELDQRLSERRRMAPVSVMAALRALKAACAAAMAGWPEPPSERARIVLCRLVN